MTDTAVAERTNTPPIVVLRGRLEDRKAEIKAALPSDINVDSFIRAVITAATLNPDILGCSWQSVWLACMTACRDGLLPDGVEGAIVPYKGKASFLPMYQGLLRRFRRSGQFRWVSANVVRQGEEFEHYIDENGEHFRHVPGDEFNAPIVKIYALATTKDGAFFATVMTIAEANKIRNMSRASREDAPWKLWESEMYKKTALRRLCKVLPSARDLVPPEEDGYEIASPSLAPVPSAGELPRGSGPAAALAQFGGGNETPGAQSDPDATASGGGGGEHEESADANVRRSSDASSATAADDELRIAHQRGQDAKVANMSRKAVPGEYREDLKDRACRRVAERFRRATVVAGVGARSFCPAGWTNALRRWSLGPERPPLRIGDHF